MSNNKKNFKNSKAYQIIVGILLILYIGYKIFAGGTEEPAQDTGSNNVEYSQEQSYEIFEETEVVADSDVTEEAEAAEDSEAAGASVTYTFRYDSLWESHYDKHGIDMGFADKEAYLAAANEVIANPDTLHKIEGEDGDDVYYLEETNEFVVVSADGYLRTYFLPDDGIDYYNRQ